MPAMQAATYSPMLYPMRKEGETPREIQRVAREYSKENTMGWV